MGLQLGQHICNGGDSWREEAWQPGPLASSWRQGGCSAPTSGNPSKPFSAKQTWKEAGCSRGELVGGGGCKPLPTPSPPHLSSPKIQQGKWLGEGRGGMTGGGRANTPLLLSLLS